MPHRFFVQWRVTTKQNSTLNQPTSPLKSWKKAISVADSFCLRDFLEWMNSTPNSVQQNIMPLQ